MYVSYRMYALRCVVLCTLVLLHVFVGNATTWTDWDLRQTCRPDRIVDVTSVSEIVALLLRGEGDEVEEPACRLAVELPARRPAAAPPEARQLVVGH